VLVEEGALSLKGVIGDLLITGEVSSETGRFAYLGNSFELNRGKAEFREFSSNLPILNVGAETFVGRENIRIDILGEVNDLNIDFYSDSELSKQDILSLLAMSGGLDDVLAGDIREAVEKEMMGMVDSALRFRVFSPLERYAAQIFDLDSITIRSFVRSQELMVNFGKLIDDRLYLRMNLEMELSPFVEQKQSFGFDYKFNDDVSLTGFLYDDGDYWMGIRAERKF